MIDDVLRGLADELTPERGVVGQRAALRLRQASIVSIDPTTGIAVVTIAGDSTPISGVRVAQHVEVSAGDSCWLVVNGPDVFVIARLGRATPPPEQVIGTADVVVTNAWATYQTKTMTLRNRATIVKFSSQYLNGNSGANRTVDFRVLMDGAVIGYEILALWCTFVSGAGPTFNVADTFIVTPTAGSHTFELQARASTNSAVILRRTNLAVIPT